MRSDGDGSWRWLALAAAAPWALLLARCSTGSAAAPTAIADASIDAAAHDDASTDGDGGSPGDASVDDRTSTPGFDGSLALDGCAANGTCAPTQPITLARGQASPGGIAVDSDSVYWIDLGGYPVDGSARPGAQVMKSAKDGGNPTVLASGTWDGTSKLGVDDAGVYWILSSSVLGCPLSGCTGAPTVLWSGAAPLYDIAVDPSGIYFTDRGSGQLSRCDGLGGTPPADGGMTDGGPAIEGGPGLLWPVGDDGGAPFDEPGAIAVDALSIYFVASSSAVMACDKNDCAGTLRTVAVSTGLADLAQLAVDDTNVYVTDLLLGRILVAPKATVSDAGISPTLSVLVDNLTTPVGLTTDGTNAFYTDTRRTDAGGGGAGRVSACAVTGCSNGQTAQVLAGFVNQPLDLAVDSTHVYWTDFGSSNDPVASDAGRVMGVDKP